MSHPASPLPQPSLAGKRILLTRPVELSQPAADSQAGTALQAEGGDELSRQLMAWGAQVLHIPLVEVQPSAFSWDDAAQFDWLFFTSKNAVRSFFAQVALGQGKHPRIAVVGPATAQCVRDLGYTVDFISPEAHAESAARTFGEQYPCSGLSMLWPCGNLADPMLQTILEAGGAKVQPLVVYETSLKREFLPRERELLQPGLDMLVFTSPSAVEAWIGAQTSLSMAQGNDTRPAIACLGPKTAQAALQLLGRVDVQARPHTLPALAEAVLHCFQEGTHP